MAAFNSTTTDVMRNATLTAGHFERTAAATFIVPTTNATLQLEPFTGVANNQHFVAAGAASNGGGAASHHHTHQTNATSSSYTFVQIKREPCQVSEVTTSNNCHHHQQLTTTQQQQHSSSMSSSSKTTLTTLVKIEASSPKVHDMDKGSLNASTIPSTNNSVPIGIAVARKRPQETATSMGNATIPVQQSLNKDVNCFGIRVADIGGVSSGCGNFYFTGNSDLITGTPAAEELALTAATGIQSFNRAPSTFWQYPSALPIESVISMSPATVGLQYQRDPSRGQVVLLPATAAALDPFQQAAAAAFVWPSYIPQGTATTALQPPPNFIFPSMSPHSSLQASSYATPLQLFGSNYLTAAAAAAAAAAATSTFCQHNQQQTNSSSSSTSTLSLGLGVAGGGSSNSVASGTTSRFLSVAATESKRLQDTLLSKQQQNVPLVLPPPTMKVEEWNATEYMATAAAKTTTTLSATTHQNHHIGSSTTALTFERDKATTNLMNLQAGNVQELNLMRLPTPPTPASLEATASQLHPQILFQANTTSSPALLNLSASGTAILPRVGSTVPSSLTTNFLNNVETTTTLTATMGGPPTPLGDEALNYKTTTIDTQQFVVGVPRVGGSVTGNSSIGPPPQMQDVNIQTDTPICSEDESSSCPHTVQNNMPTSASVASTTPPPSEMDVHETETEQPLELTTAGGGVVDVHADVDEVPQNAEAPCHKSETEEGGATDEFRGSGDSSYVDHNVFEISTEASRATAVESKTLSGAVTNVPAAGATSTEELMSAASKPITLQATAEDLTGLELLSNISTSSLAKNSCLSVKLEPVEHSEYIVYTEVEQNNNATNLRKSVGRHSQNIPVENNVRTMLPTQAPLTEPLGGLNLLCALAEQRMQEEVQSSGSIFSMNTNDHVDQMVFQPPLPPSLPPLNLELKNNTQRSSQMTDLTPPIVNEAKRKKHKHSKSSKSSKKSQRISKKSKKKCAKEKRKNKHPPPPESLESVLDFENDEDLQEDFKSAFDKVDSNYKRFGKWPDREEIFKAMESDMRMRLAEITRQYRKKKRKLNEISKSQKLKKKTLKSSVLNGQLSGVTIGSACSSMSCLSNMNLVANPSTTSSTTISSSPLCDYKFSKLIMKPSSGTSGSYLSPSNFLRFTDNKPQIQSQFPPAADVDLSEALVNTPSCSSSSLYKPLRLEPSSLAASESGRSTPMRSKKHSSLEKSSTLTTTSCKPRKLAAARLSSDSEAAASKNRSLKGGSGSCIDRELVLASEHLYRKETRVLTDMGGLFYAGIMKPLQPPDVYAITLDGERGNKSHIMSREEIYKDTILEVSPNSIDKVPVGTRLCAYWSQQYRCLYPGRAIESEISDDGTKNDFVSVEFDDGDSGRIRLQNIRFLLSDYPIAEYDNPLYSLGKQKRSVSKSGNNSEPTQHQETHSVEDEQHHGTEMQQKSLDLFIHRKEKKRIKNFKKSLTNSSISCSGLKVSSDPNERLHKHHKHKKRKKHKKHHHRKALATETEANSSYVVNASTIYGNRKQEQPPLGEDAEEANDGLLKCENENMSLHKIGITSKSNKLKMESSLIMEIEAESVAFKVKTENFDLEEETTSNMMSEGSDEAKIDDEEIEHNNSKGSKIAAFLPERQLWGWCGKTYRKAGVKGRARKQFYKTIKRGKETITVGDCAVFLSTGRPDRPYIGRIESMWETASSNKIVRVRWFYHPEETIGCPNLKYPGALFESPHEDENDVQTISHRCAVLTFMCYFEKFGADSKQYESIYDNNDTYYLSGYYNPRLQVLKLQDDIPTIEKKNTTDE